MSAQGRSGNGDGWHASVDVPEIERAIVERVAERHAEWFPERGAPGAASISLLGSRRRSRIYAVRVGPPTVAPSVVAKVRLPAGVSLPGRAAVRPMLSTAQLPEEELTALEYDGLTRILTAFGTEDPRFAVVRPLDILTKYNTILMDYVPATTLRHVLVGRSRLRTWNKAAGQPAGLDDAFHRVGSWLQTFQAALEVGERPERQADREDVVQQFHALGSYLSHRVGAPAIGDLARRGAELAAAVLPERLPLAMGHGDFAPRNVSLGTDGRVVVFDPLPRWAVPAQEDVCRFLVGMRLLGLRVHTRGAAFAPGQIERLEDQVISGYFESPVPASEFRCYQLLLMLDKWAALAQPSGGRSSARVRWLSLQMTSPFVRQQASQVLELGETAIER